MERKIVYYVLHVLSKQIAWDSGVSNIDKFRYATQKDMNVINSYAEYDYFLPSCILFL